jgi:hypothetical protein
LSIIAIKASEREYASAGQSPGGRVPVPRMSTRSQETKTHEGKTSSPTQRMSLLNVNADENTSVAGPSSCRTCGTMCAACNPTRPDGAANVLGQQLDNLEKRLGTLGQAVNGEMMAVRNNLHGKYITRHQRRIEQGEVKMQEHEERLDNLTREAARMYFFIDQIGGYLSRTAGVEWQRYPEDTDEDQDQEDEGMYVENHEGEQCPDIKRYTSRKQCLVGEPQATGEASAAGGTHAAGDTSAAGDTNAADEMGTAGEMGPAGEGSNAAESADGEQRAAVAEGAADEASAEDVENPEGEQCPT